MTRRCLFVTLALAIGLFATSASGQTFGAVLTGAQEVPATTSPGWGNFTATLDSTHTNLTVTWTVTNLGSPISGFHIHQKTAGQQTGGIVVNIQGLGGTFVNGKLTGTFPITTALATQMLADPSSFYANVHTNQFPGGAIRGDLAINSGGMITYAADLRGSNEVPPNSSTAYGSAFVTIDPNNNQLSWEVDTTGLSPTLSHIHGPAPAGVNASVLINFATSAAAFTNGRTKGSIAISSLAPATLATLLSDPSQFYVNVHSATFPGGEIRGQLTNANEYDVAVSGHVTNGLGQTFVTDVRVFNPSFDTPVNALLEYFQSGTTANVNATQAMAVSIPARGTAALDDATGTSGLNGSGIGAIRVSGASKLTVTSRIFADLRSSGKGTFGQFAAGFPRSAALRRGALPQLSNRSDLSAGSRTNVGFFNPSNQTATVRLELRDATGALVGSGLLSLQALSQQQNSIGTYFPGVDLSNATNLTLSFDASVPIVVYASVVDNVSTDQIFVFAQEDTGVAASQ
jgi:hypothetical protein